MRLFLYKSRGHTAPGKISPALPEKEGIKNVRKSKSAGPVREGEPAPAQEKYNFLYLGELLERYEERFGMPLPDLRALCSLQKSFVRPECHPHDVLLAEGYTTLEIAYANVLAVRSQIFDGEISGLSVVAEKIVVELFRNAIPKPSCGCPHWKPCKTPFSAILISWNPNGTAW